MRLDCADLERDLRFVFANGLFQCLCVKYVPVIAIDDYGIILTLKGGVCVRVCPCVHLCVPVWISEMIAEPVALTLAQ